MWYGVLLVAMGGAGELGVCVCVCVTAVDYENKNAPLQSGRNNFANIESRCSNQGQLNVLFICVAL